MNAHKPLPNPPTLQTVDPLNSPIAQRTLIDAEIGVTPSSAEWPALSPDNVPSEGDGGSQHTNTVNATDSSFPFAESLSLPGPHELTAGALDYSYGLSLNLHEKKAGSSSLSPVKSSHADIGEGFAPDTTIHALATPDEKALESPLARKVAIPPRVSSKRAPVPISVTLQESQMVHAAAMAASRRRAAGMDDTQWPLPNTEGNYPFGIIEPQLEPAKMTSLNDARTRNAHGLSDSRDTYHNATLHRASAYSASSWSQAAGSSIYDDEPEFEEPGYRTKRISDHSSKSEPGPLLKISEEADAILLGKEPPMPDNTTIMSTLRQGSLSMITSRTMSRLSAGVSRSRTHQTITERGATRLSTPGEGQQKYDPLRSTPTQESNVTVRKRSSKVIQKLTTVASTGLDQHLATPPSFSNTVRSKISPALTRPSPRPPRAEASPSYARSTVASSRNTSMLDQRAVLRNPANSPNRSSGLNSEHSHTHSKNDSKPLQKKGSPSTGEKEVKPKRSLRNMLSFRDTKEKVPPVPAVPKHSSRIGSVFGGQFIKSSANLRAQRATRESGGTTRRAIPKGQDNNTQLVPSPSTGSDHQATSAGPHTQRKDGVVTQRAVSEGQNGNTRPVPPSSVRSCPPATTTPDAITTVNKIINHASQLPETSSVRLRGLEIAQVCTTMTLRARMLDELVLTVQMKQALLASVDACKTAQIAATQAQQSARLAELSMQRSAIELGRLFKLCEDDLDDETVQLIKGLVRNAWDSAFPLSPLTTSRSTSNAQ